MDNNFHKMQAFKTLMQNSLWNHDYYPDLPDLEPNSTIELFRHDGSGIIRTIHLTLNIDGQNRDELLRKVYLKVTYNRLNYPSVYTPVGDFFCDSFSGKSISFSGMLMAKRPTNSLYCYIPMPFEKSVTVELVNTTDKKVTGYGYVTAEKIPAWESDNAYFHARWIDKTVHLPEEAVPLLNTQGKGHFFGCHLTAISNCPHFLENQGICEGNDEFYIDGSIEPIVNYLGTEDFFGFSWNWRKLWYDNYSGTTYLNDDDGITKLACYRFFLNDPIRFSRSLKAQINYEYDIKNPPLIKAKEEGNGIVTFGIVVYWYQDRPVNV